MMKPENSTIGRVGDIKAHVSGAFAWRVSMLGKKTKDFQEIDLEIGDDIILGWSPNPTALILTPNGWKLITPINRYMAKVKLDDGIQEFTQEKFGSAIITG